MRGRHRHAPRHGSARRVRCHHDWVVDQLQGHELVAGQLEHRQRADLSLRHFPQHLVPEPCVERDRPSGSAIRKPTCNVLIAGPRSALVDDAFTGTSGG